jgi:hypothetical protein
MRSAHEKPRGLCLKEFKYVVRSGIGFCNYNGSMDEVIMVITKKMAHVHFTRMHYGHQAQMTKKRCKKTSNDEKS